MNHAAIRSCTLIAAIGFASVAAFGVDPPDLRINSTTGLIETVDATWSGSNYNVRHTLVDGAGNQSSSLLLSTSAADDLDPRIAISSAGDAHVTWWRDAAKDVVLYRKRSVSTGTWSAERAVGFSSESNSRPRIIFAGKIVVVYQIQNAKSRSVGAQVMDDDPEPFTRSIVGTTSYNGDLDIQAFFAAGHFWITWIDTQSRVAYSEYNFGTRLWTPVAFESFAADSPSAARTRIRDILLNY